MDRCARKLNYEAIYVTGIYESDRWYGDNHDWQNYGWQALNEIVLGIPEERHLPYLPFGKKPYLQPPNYPIWEYRKIQNWAFINGNSEAEASVKEIKKELRNGPVCTRMDWYDGFENWLYKHGEHEIFHDEYEGSYNKIPNISVYVTIVGWDSKDEKDYWIVRYSFLEGVWGMDIGPVKHIIQGLTPTLRETMTGL